MVESVDKKLIKECVNEFEKVQKSGSTKIFYLITCYYQCPMQLNLSCNVNVQ